MNPIQIAALGAATALASAALAVPAHAAAAEDPPEVVVSEVVANGTGCGADARPLVHLENRSRRLTIEYPALYTQAGQVPQDNGTRPWVPRANRNCQVNLKLSYPAGWTFAVTRVGGMGYADLAERTTAKSIGTYYFAGMTETGEFQSALTGPLTDTYSYLDGVGSPNWSECGKTRALNVNARIQVDASKADRQSLSEMTLDATVANLEWRRC
ncbi:hypothetical protein GCM10010124_37650 [Pilimelia terevasa]|uniref:Secreted protein n=1 Tax=Pilimelia terevasa TaxID=53372 RepID=A0A8J3FLD9_9ACTN|nr:DUF4360 domain-containing protein [Pilimelia terevasa]GGK41265.1 hypothetical protein GCM10010124_37650 [Pilimelia terevasa]